LKLDDISFRHGSEVISRDERDDLIKITNDGREFLKGKNPESLNFDIYLRPMYNEQDS